MQDYYENKNLTLLRDINRYIAYLRNKKPEQTKTIWFLSSLTHKHKWKPGHGKAFNSINSVQFCSKS